MLLGSVSRHVVYVEELVASGHVLRKFGTSATTSIILFVCIACTAGNFFIGCVAVSSAFVGAAVVCKAWGARRGPNTRANANP